MARNPYLTAPVATTRMPPGIPYIIANEFAERFSFYGMRAILVIFMTRYLMDREGGPAVMTDADARAVYHFFTAAVYGLPLFGSLLADVFLGKYRTVILLSIAYCFGHLALALDDTRTGLFIGLALIALGAGGIKPCVSANVGDQFGQSNEHLLSKVYGWFYFSINLGSMCSTLLTPVLLDRYGPNVAFAVPGVLMLLATIVFWMGRHRFVHIPPAGPDFLRDVFSRDGLRALGKLGLVFFFVIVFWSLYDQTGSAWVLQAQHMDRRWLGVEWLESQIQAVNPFLILIFIPLFNYVIYPGADRFFHLSTLRKVYVGFFLTTISFVIPAWVEHQIENGLTPSIGWQILSYVLLTAGEVMVSITCLEFSYTNAPRRMKSFISALFWLTIALGNVFTAGVNIFIQNPDGTTMLEGPAYYLFFAGLMFVTSVIFVIVAELYKEQRYIQEEVPAGTT